MFRIYCTKQNTQTPNILSQYLTTLSIPKITQSRRSMNAWSMEHWWNDTDRVKPKHSKKKKYPSVTLFATNPTWTGLHLNPSLHGARLATNRLSHAWTLIVFDSSSINYLLHSLTYTLRALFHCHFNTLNETVLYLSISKGLDVTYLVLFYHRW
jgi:hypothetical protein